MGLASLLETRQRFPSVSWTAGWRAKQDPFSMEFARTASPLGESRLQRV